MQQSTSHIGNARREERVPLSALIELRTEYGDEALSADVLDISQSGVQVRAAFVPEPGTRLLCDFRCPPTDDAVHAVAEVIWADWDGPRSGCFGLRFLELDTKSATTIRRYVEPEAAAEAPAPPRVANMRIDGVGAPIEADVRLLERDCIVLEQELSFLRLGRGIEVDVPGRGKERGRIASIELRQGPLDTPTLVFGVLLDEKPEPAVQDSRREPPSSAREPEPAAALAPD
ncbi:MAG TPA: PilZ domain-containing protein, partial [Polyangiales bacterium]